MRETGDKGKKGEKGERSQGREKGFYMYDQARMLKK
jgi:hypothetical protein